MNIQISDNLQGHGASQSFEVSLKLKDTTWQGEVLSFQKPLAVTGQVTNSGDMLTLTARVKGTTTLQCGACLDQYEQPLDFALEAELIKASGEKDPDLFIYEGDGFNLSEIVQEFLFLEIPSLRRCREDCKGLCLECGTNLNHEECQCSNTEEDNPEFSLDSRLRALKDYFSTEGKEV